MASYALVPTLVHLIHLFIACFDRRIYIGLFLYFFILFQTYFILAASLGFIRVISDPWE